MAKELIEMTEQSREKEIVRTSVIGIVINLVLAGFKAIIVTDIDAS